MADKQADASVAEQLATTLQHTSAAPSPVSPELRKAEGAVSTDGPTAPAPSFRAPVPSLGGLPALVRGDRLADFEIVAVLGAGAFATVYLARQLSLDRQVALKVSANRGTEARTLANLEHDHIVRVFAEVVDEQRDWRLLCMQYVNGTTLEKVLRGLAAVNPDQWRGRSILDAIDTLATRPATFDPAMLRDRDLLGRAAYSEAVAWLGARVAEALAHAHSQGILHRDIKPANILLNRYGRPFLADFNIAADQRPAEGPDREMFGGTLAYMAPEHLDAFNPEMTTPPEAVDRRSDIYSLGVVLFEMLAGTSPFPAVNPTGSVGQVLRQLAAIRRETVPKLGAHHAVPPMLERIVQRCLHADPDQRYASADDLARALEGFREQYQIEQELPAAGILTHALRHRPFVVGCLLFLLPHVLGSIVNIWYNRLCIVDQLSPLQQNAFHGLVLGYNLLVYPVCVWLVFRVTVPVYRAWGHLTRGGSMEGSALAAVRRQVLRWPRWAVILSCAGWLPGGLLFPLILDLFAGTVDAGVFGHFLISFTISGLIALTYSVFSADYLALCVLYPCLWMDTQRLRQQARVELQNLPRQLLILQLLAGLIPLTGAILMIDVGPEQFDSGYRSFRLLVTALIALGMLGFGVAVTVSGRISQTLAALTGAGRG